MRFENEFKVAAPQEEVWEALMDIERVTPCLPGARVIEKKSDSAFAVSIKVKLGPVTMNYAADIEITERDDAAHTAKMVVTARETRGQGNAEAEVSMTTQAEGERTTATVVTDLKLSGRAASMGQSLIADVSTMLVNRFATNLAAMLEGKEAEKQPAAAGAAAGQSGPQTGSAAAPEDEDIGLPITSLVADSLLKQAQANAAQISLVALLIALIALLRSGR